MNLEYRLLNMGLMKFNADLFIYVFGFQNNWPIWQIECKNSVNLNKDAEVLHIVTTMELFFPNDPENKRFVSLTGFADFHLTNWKQYSEVEGPEIPQDFVSVLLGVVYSSFRGLVMDRTSIVGGILLPLVNSRDLHREMIEIPKAEQSD